jgi:uncharacterized protein YdbL (DUF1318 family)
MTIRSGPTRRAALAAMILLSAFPQSHALSQSSAKALVDAAKAAGKIGEQSDGFLGFVTTPDDPGLQAAVEEINAGRRRVYEETARRNGVTPEVAGVAAFKILRDTKLKAGDYYRDVDGVWRRK